MPNDSASMKRPAKRVAGRRPHGTCDLCLRSDLPGLTFHHLIPQTCHPNAWFRKNFTLPDMRTRGLNLCRECHNAIHDFIPSEKDLGRHYNSRDLLLGHEKIARHVDWISKRAFQRHRVGS
jgi:hypothetical protein